MRQRLVSPREATGLLVLLVALLFKPATSSGAGPMPVRLFDDGKKQPAAFHLGIDYLPDNAFTISTDGTRQRDGLGDMRAGLECTALSRFAPRFGYRPDRDERQGGMMSDLVAGFRWKIGSEQLVYAFAPFRSDGTAHYLSLTVRFK